MAAISSSTMDASSIATPVVVTPAGNLSPRVVVDNTGNSPRSRRGRRPVTSESPWTQIVRGDSHLITTSPPSPSAVAPSSESSSSSSFVVEEENAENGIDFVSGNAGKKSAWNKPGNGSSPPEIAGVMGGESWPALSESARASAKSYPDSLKSFPDGSSSIPSVQMQGNVIVSSCSQTTNQGSDLTNLNLTSNHTSSPRQRPSKRGVSSPSAITHTTAPQGPGGEAHASNPSLRDNIQRVSQTRGSNDNQQHRNSFRNRGGTQNNSFGARRDSERASQDWHTRSFNGRDANMHPQRSMPRFIRQPPPPPPLVPTSSPFMVPAPTVRPYGAPIAYSDYHMYYFPPPMDSFRSMPFYPGPISPVFIPPADLHLHSKIVNQIDYYFSNENLVKDTFLRQNMDDQGWVPIRLIAGFKKVLNLTDNIQLILDAVRSSSVVELQGDKVRRQSDWMRWIMPPAVRYTGGNSVDDVASDSMQSLSIEQAAPHSIAE